MNICNYSRAIPQKGCGWLAGVFRRIRRVELVETETHGLDFFAENGFRYALRARSGLLNPRRCQKCQVVSL